MYSTFWLNHLFYPQPFFNCWPFKIFLFDFLLFKLLDIALITQASRFTFLSFDISCYLLMSRSCVLRRFFNAWKFFHSLYVRHTFVFFHTFSHARGIFSDAIITQLKFLIKIDWQIQLWTDMNVRWRDEIGRLHYS